MYEQLSFLFIAEEDKKLHNIFQRTFIEVKSKFKRVDGETVEDYVDFLKKETLLEVAEKLKEIANYRDNLNIELKYGKGQINDRCDKIR